MDTLRWKCSTCGEEHEGLPDMSFHAPIYYQQVPEPDRARRAQLTSDTCVIDGEDRFVRGCLEVPILDAGSMFVWGAWVSLSQRNFDRYVETFAASAPEGEGPYFGWLSNRLPGYPETLNLKARVHLQAAGKRPLIELEPTDHPLAVHQREGIPLTRLLAILGEGLHRPN